MISPRLIFLVTFAVLASLLVTDAGAAQKQRPEVSDFIEHMHIQHGFKREELRTLFAKVETKQSILDAMSRPAERVVPWHEYRARFINDKRLAQGVEFWQAHRERLEGIEASGVPASVVLGILGVETYFGNLTGRYRVIDALTTLAFDYPARGEFFRKELEQFLLLTREEKIDPLNALGSYAGAMGTPQFMPTSYRKFAVDADGDGHRDLWKNWDDALGSIANFLKEHGWQSGQPVVVRATLRAGDGAALDGSKTELNESVKSLRDKNLKFDTELADDTSAMLIVHTGTEGLEYRVGFNNFYVITRYNRSKMYATAVYELGDAIMAAARRDARASP